jgi:hypothetical protein
VVNLNELEPNVDMYMYLVCSVRQGLQLLQETYRETARSPKKPALDFLTTTTTP